MNARAFIMQLVAIAFAIIVAPLLIGWVNQCRAWLQNRRGPGLLQPYRLIRKLFHKDAVIATNASPLFRLVPYVQFASMGLAAGIIPSLWTGLPFADAADTIALVGLFATARMFLALAAMDIGTAFGSMGARREMLVGFLAEPALLMVFFTASLISHSTSLPTMVNVLAHGRLAIYPSLAFASISFLMVLLAENARIPVDNPTTHLELTMIHEATVLEYSARHLALIEWASALKLFNYVCIGFALFAPWGLAQGLGNLPDLAVAVPVLFIKLVAVGFGLALVETINAKMRIFRVPEFLASAFLLAVLGLLVHLLLGH
ncbi:MAG: respiratory chain complex I subunit 1 family protein [Acidiferrobacteraceae bacterium]